MSSRRAKRLELMPLMTIRAWICFRVLRFVHLRHMDERWWQMTLFDLVVFLIIYFEMLHNMIFVGTVSVIDLWPSKLVNI